MTEKTRKRKRDKGEEHRNELPSISISTHIYVCVRVLCGYICWTGTKYIILRVSLTHGGCMDVFQGSHPLLPYCTMYVRHAGSTHIVIYMRRYIVYVYV